MLELMKITLFVALVPRDFAFVVFANRRAVSCRLPSSKWESDFDGYVGDNNDNENDTFLLSDLFGARANTVEDLSGCQVRQFFLGEDLVLTDFVGKQVRLQLTYYRHAGSLLESNRLFFTLGIRRGYRLGILLYRRRWKRSHGCPTKSFGSGSA